MALTTVSATKIHLGLSGTSEDAFLTQLLAAVEAAFLRLVDRAIAATDYVDFYSGNDSRILLLNEYPVLSVSSVRVDASGAWGQATDAFPATSELVAGTDYALSKDGRNGECETGRLYRINGVWPGRFEYRRGLLSPRMRPGGGNIKVSFRAGYETVPSEIPLAIWQTVAELRARRANGLVASSQGFDGASLGYLQQQAQDMLLTPGSRAQVVSRFKRRAPRFNAYS